MTTYYLLHVGSLLSRFVPLKVMYAVAGLAGRVAALLPTRARAAARANIARAMGRPVTSRCVRRAAAHAFRCQALNYVDLMRLDRVTVAALDAALVHGDLTEFLDIVARGKGCIVVSAHIGNMDYVGQWLAVRGYPIHTAMERLQPERLNQLVIRQRASAGLQVHPAASGTLGILTDALRRGEVVALVADRAITGAGLDVEFFGAPARLPVGPALLGLRTGAPIVAAFGHRLHDDRLYVAVRPPVQLTRTHNLRADLLEGTRLLARLLEDGIARAPDQWLAFEPIWKGGAA